MIFYIFASDTKEYVGKVDTVGKPLNSTTIQPPVVQFNEIAIFDEDNSLWKVSKDFRGKVVFNKITKEPLVYFTIGNLPDNLTEINCPNRELYSWSNDTNDWIQDPGLYLIKDKKIRKETMDSLQWLFDRHDSEKRLLNASKINKTTLTEIQILELDVYFDEWRNFTENWFIGKSYPVKPSFLGV